MIAILDAKIEKLDKQIADLIAKTPTLTKQARLLAEAPGVGPTVLATLLRELPELGALDLRRIASLAGLAPHARESGTWKGVRRIWGGRRKVREVLSIAALTASPSSSPCATICVQRERPQRPSSSQRPGNSSSSSTP